MNQHQRKPNIIGWEITNQCNLHCPHCYNPIDRSNQDELTNDECIRIIDSLAKFKPEIIGWTGGEPLLCENLEELISYAWKNHNIKSGVTTNGVLLDENRAKKLQEAGVNSIQISLDGTTPERSRKIRLTSDEDFDKIIEAVRICIRLGIKINLAMLLGQENLDDAEKMLDLARREKVSAIRFCGFTPAGRGQKDPIRKRFSFKGKLQELHDFIEKAQSDESVVAMFDPGFGPVPPEYYFHECIAGIQTCYIKANGDVYPCTSLLYDEFKVGNIRESSFEDIWNYPAMLTMVNFPRDEIKGYCSKCDNFDQCFGACRSLTYSHTGNYFSSFPVCLYQAKKKSSVRIKAD